MRQTAKLVAVMVALSVTGDVRGRLAVDLWTGAETARPIRRGCCAPGRRKGRRCCGRRPSASASAARPSATVKVYLLDRDEKVGDTLRVFDLASGKELWTFAYDAPGTFMFAGSRTTPTVDGDHVYTSGPLGDLYCHQHEDAQAGLAQEHLEGLRRRRAAPVGHRPASAHLRQPGDRGAADIPGGRGRLRQADRRAEMEVGAAVRASRIREPVRSSRSPARTTWS